MIYNKINQYFFTAKYKTTLQQKKHIQLYKYYKLNTLKKPKTNVENLELFLSGKNTKIALKY